MAVFSLRTHRQLLQRMIDYVVARTALTDVTDGDALKQVLGAVARQIAQLYVETARLLELFGIDRAVGADLDARARDYMPDGIARRGPTYAAGTVRWTRPTATGSAILIPTGTVVAKPGSPQQTYVTTVAGAIAAGATQSARTDGLGDISAVAVGAGVAGNATIGAVSKQITIVSGTSAVTNPTPFVGGAAAEADDAFRARIRARTRSLARTIKEALETRALDAVLTSGTRCRVARTRVNPWKPGLATIYVDDGTGFAEVIFDAAAETLVESATGGERYLYSDNRPLVDDAWDLVLIPGNGDAQRALALDVDYKAIAPWGQFTLGEVAFPTGLAAGDKVTLGAYRYWGGLIAEVQKLLDGDLAATDYDDTTSWGAGGIVVRARTPIVRWITVDATVAVLDGYERATVAAEVRSAIDAYINGLNVGDDVIRSELIERAMAVPGMYDVLLTAPASNRPIADNELARIQASNLTVQ